LVRDLRLGVYDVLVGINLLREGLDIPEVSLVAILDADNEGFLRSERSLIQTAGRAARNVDGLVILYANHVTDSMRRAIEETGRRRLIQLRYNEEHHITPQTIQKEVTDILAEFQERRGLETATELLLEMQDEFNTAPGPSLTQHIQGLERAMKQAAERLDFEKAAALRDRIKQLRLQELALQ